MKNKVLKIGILAVALVLMMQVIAFASMGTVALVAKTDKDTYKVGDKIILTIDWGKEAQSAGCTIKYDKDKLAFDSTTEGVNFYNADTDGEILFNWASFDGSIKTNVVFVLTAKAEGTANIIVEDGKGFDDGTMTGVDGYTYTNKTVTITKVEDQTPGGDTTPGGDAGDTGIGGTGNSGTGIGGDTTPGGDTTTSDEKSDDTTAKEPIPDTGVDMTVIVAMLIVTALGTMAFVGYRRLADV